MAGLFTVGDSAFLTEEASSSFFVEVRLSFSFNALFVEFFSHISLTLSATRGSISPTLHDI